MEWRGGTIKVLVTGGAGYIGSVIVDELLDAGHDVTIYDHAYPWNRNISKRPYYVEGDIIDANYLRATILLRGIEAVIHLAGLIEAGLSVTDPERFYLTNVGGMAALLEAVRSSKVRHLVFSSTASVYGDSLSPLLETTPPNPPNTYAESKLMAEYMMSSVAQVRGMSCIPLRFANVAGATMDRFEQHEPETHLIPKLLRSIKEATTFEVYGTDYPTPDGSAVRDYIHVKDVASAHLFALRLPPGFEVYNVGTGCGHSVWDVVKAAEEVTGKLVMDTAMPRRAGDQPISVLDSSKLQALGWKPHHSSMKNILETAWAHC